MQRRKIYFVTTNAGKMREAGLLFRDHFDVEQVDRPYPELQEDDLSKVAAYGAKYCAEQLGKPLIVEDSGLFVDALKGFPGPYSAYVQRTLGNQGVLKLMEGEKNRRAEFRSVVAYCAPGEQPVTFTGIWWGELLTEEVGANGFGYDPIFAYRRFPVGEMTTEQKNEVSHRTRALLQFREWYESRPKGAK